MQDRTLRVREVYDGLGRPVRGHYTAMESKRLPEGDIMVIVISAAGNEIEQLPPSRLDAAFVQTGQHITIRGHHG